MNDLNIAKKYLQENEELKLVLVKKGDIIYTSKDRGIKPLYELTEYKDIDAKNASLADRVIGKGAAILVDYLNIKNVYGELMSEGAIEKLEEININFYYESKVEYIENRDRSDLCPVEKISKDINSGEELLKSLKRFLNK